MQLLTVVVDEMLTKKKDYTSGQRGNKQISSMTKVEEEGCFSQVSYFETVKT